MRCPHCEGDIPDGFRFCGQCGQPLAARCPECEFENPPGMRFCGQCGKPLTRAGEPPASHVAEPAPSADAEHHPGRRQLTVLFCDLVGSTPLSYRLDPEDLRELLRAYQDCAVAVVQRYDGTVSRFMGDGLLCLFGYPRAHEDDAERAVHTGLDIVASMTELNQHYGKRHAVELRVRIGIATGLVVVGDIIGEGAAEEHAVVGETPNLAARLQSLGEPDSVIVAPGTRNLAGGVFDYEDLGEQPVRGLPEPVRLWRVRGRRPLVSRFEQTRSADLTPLVGRGDQMALLARLLDRATEGHGQGVLISGEGGVGKSRLVQQFFELVAQRPHGGLRFQCSPHHTDSELYPVLSFFERHADFAPGDDASARLHKLDRLLHPETPARQQRRALLADLLHVRTAETEDTLSALSAPQRRNLLIEMLVEQFDLLARERLLLVVLEDVHWMDPTTGELLKRMMDRIAAAPVLALLTTRPGFEAAWLDQAHATTITLNRLDQREAAQLARAVAGGHPLPRRVVADIVAKADGVPLFVEELTKTVLESSQMRLENGRWQLDGTLASLSVPSSLQDSLVARLDQLGSVREVAHVAAALGREFGVDLLAVLTPLTEPRLHDALVDLVAAQILLRRGMGAEESFSFRHALLQDACYESMLRGTRQQLHARIAEVLLERFPDVVARQPELIAHHFSRALRHDLAVEHWMEAGRRASERSASVEAVRHLGNGLEALRQLPDDDTRARRELPLLTMLGAALINAEGPGSSEVQRVYVRARELRAADDGEISLERFATLWGEWRICSNEWTASGLAIEMEALARQRGDNDLLLQARHAHWATLFVLGDLAGCERCVAETLPLYDPARHASHATLYGGHDAGVCGLGQSALVMALRGDFGAATTKIEQALELAAHIEHGASLAHGFDHQMMLLHYRRDASRLLALAEHARAHAERHDCADYRARAESFAASARFALGEHERGREELRESIAEQRNTMGDSDDLPVFLDMLAAAAMQAGETEVAAAHVAEGLALGERNGMQHWRAELLRRQAALQRLAGDGASGVAEQTLRDAVEIARTQGAELLRLRALTMLCEVSDNARGPFATLRSLHDQLAGLGTGADLQEAQAVLRAAGA